MRLWVSSLALQLVAAGALLPSAYAELPPLLRSENSNVRDGNEKLNRGDAKGALESYTLAARQLPEAPGVQLDRGLALLKSGDLAKARESFLSATTPSATPALRADAYENLALLSLLEGDDVSAQATAHRLLVLDPKNYNGRLVAGVAAVNQGQFTKARDILAALRPQDDLLVAASYSVALEESGQAAQAARVRPPRVGPIMRQRISW